MTEPTTFYEHRVVGLLSGEEKVAFAKRAVSLGRSLSQHVRQLILDDLAREPVLDDATPPPCDDVAAKQEVRKLLNNKRGRRGMDVEVRFWGFVANCGAADDDCWEWTGALKDGYGTFILKKGPLKASKAHRVAWVLTNGPIQEGMQVLHECDNRACCNPRHLRLGTHTDNMVDKVMKGRAKGNRRGPLTTSQATQLRELFLSNRRTVSDIATEYGVSKSYVSRVFRGMSMTSEGEYLSPIATLPWNPRQHHTSTEPDERGVYKLHGVIPVVRDVIDKSPGMSFPEIVARVGEVIPTTTSIVRASLRRLNGRDVIFRGRHRWARYYPANPTTISTPDTPQ